MLEAIRATPDRLDNLVYADWLLQRGGVRGELIGQSVQLEREPDNPLLAQRVAALASEAETTLPAGVTVTWKRGFVSKASVTADPEHLVAALQHPLLQLVEELSVGAPEAPLRRNGGTHYSDALLDVVLREAPIATIRRLELGDGTTQVLATPAGGQRLLERFPLLDALTLHAKRFTPKLFGVLSPRLVEFELAQANLTDELMQGLSTQAWPHLRKLVLHLRRRQARQAPMPLEALMTGSGFPELRDLRFREHANAGGMSNQFCTEVVAAPIFVQLETFDISVEDLNLDALRPFMATFRHLRRLLPSAEAEAQQAPLTTVQRCAWLLEDVDTRRAIALSRLLVTRVETAHDRHNVLRRLGSCLCLNAEFDEAIAAHEKSLVAEALRARWGLKSSRPSSPACARCTTRS